MLLLIILVRRRRKREAELEGAPLQLPFWATIGSTYAFTWKNAREFIRISWCCLLLMFACSFFASALLFHPGATPQASGPASYDLWSLLPSLPELIAIIFGASIAVAWHRFILRQERIDMQPYLRFDGLVRNYIWVALIIYILEAVPNALTSLLTPTPNAALEAQGPFILAGIFGFFISITAGYYGARISLLLPARALGLTQITVKDVLRRTRLSGWRLFWAPLFILLPVTIIYALMVIFLLKSSALTIADLADSSFFRVLMFVLFTPLYLSFLSFSFRYFFEGDDRPPPEHAP
jgi:hypothetical protein